MKYFTIPKQYGPKTEAETWYDEIMEADKEYMDDFMAKRSVEIARIIKEMKEKKSKK